MKKWIAFLMVLVLLLTACAQKPKLEEDEIWELVSEAYTYVFPLVIMDATKTTSTNTVAAESGRAPVNQFIHAEKLADASFKTVVTPNVDTVYTQAWLDLAQEPVIYVMPEADRFFNVQVLDAWTNTVAVLDEPGIYAFTLPDWQGQLPEGAQRVNIPTADAWFIARIILSGQEDLYGVYEIQHRMEIMPLSAYQRGNYTAPDGSYSESNDFVPVQKVLSMDPRTFFDRANALMLTNPPAEADKELLERIAQINVGPGLTFDVSLLGKDVSAQWTQMLQQLRATLTAASAKFGEKLGQWQYFGKPIGDFGTEYAYRAAVALVGLGANTVDVAVYPKTDVDKYGATLTGEHTYVLHFDSLPPTLEGGFWSVTAYGSDDFLIDNPIDRYCINDRTNFELNEDGSLDIILSHEQPEDTTNWLPISEDVFHLYMRIYIPDMDALADWQPPVITVIVS